MRALPLRNISVKPLIATYMFLKKQRHGARVHGFLYDGQVREGCDIDVLHLSASQPNRCSSHISTPRCLLRLIIPTRALNQAR